MNTEKSQYFELYERKQSFLAWWHWVGLCLISINVKQYILKIFLDFSKNLRNQKRTKCTNMIILYVMVQSLLGECKIFRFTISRIIKKCFTYLTIHSSPFAEFLSSFQIKRNRHKKWKMWLKFLNAFNHYLLYFRRFTVASNKVILF